MRKCYLFSGAAVLLGCLAFWAASSFARTDPCPAGPAAEHPEDVPPHCGPVEGCESSLEVPPDTDNAPSYVTGPAPLPWPAKPLPPAQPLAPVPLDDEAVRPGDRHQESSVRLSWMGPETAPVGRPTTYTLAVRNTCSAPVTHVCVEVRLPEGMRVTGTVPEGDHQEACLRWELGTLTPGQRKDLQVNVVPHVRGEIVPRASVRFTGGLPLPVHAREPRLSVRVACPGQAQEGGRAAFVIQVANPGDGTARGVRVHASLSEGLDYGAGNPLVFDLGDLAPGHNRCLTVPCSVRGGGLQWCEARASADGDLSARDTAEVRVAVPRLEVKMDGPGVRYLGRKALYTFTVSNTGPAPARGVVLEDRVPDGLAVVAASGDGRHDSASRTVSWALGEIPAGQARTVKLEVKAARPGDHEHRCVAASSSGARAEDGVMTTVRGLSALRLELLDREDPVEVAAENVYEVRISNTGSDAERDIRVVASLPEGMEFLGAEGPSRYLRQGEAVVFEPLPRLAAGAEARYRVRVRSVRAGTYRFQIRVTSAHVTEPVIVMEATRVYADREVGVAPR
jgi:uncharacterized repeat protein (TIGR01451 family)